MPRPPSKPQIDLSGPQGNAFVLLALVRNCAKQLAWEDDYLKEVLDDMKSHDYEHLLVVLNRHLGEHVDFILPPNFQWSAEPLKVSDDVDVEWDIAPSPSSPKM